MSNDENKPTVRVSSGSFGHTHTFAAEAWKQATHYPQLADLGVASVGIVRVQSMV